MGVCATCGNDYQHSFQVVKEGNQYTFDCFECAIEKLAPRCPQCGVRIIGHGVQHDETIYCCAHCAKRSGASDLVDHD